jgi:excisionase family DNA binding protein
MVIHIEGLEERLNSIEGLLAEIKHTLSHLSPQAEEDTMLRIGEAADFLNLSKATVYSLVSRMELPCSKQSKLLWFSKKELSEYRKSGKRKTLVELSKDAGSYISSKRIVN